MTPQTDHEMYDNIRRILLVDDEASIRNVLSISLEDRGYEVHTAKDGKTALSVFWETRPCIVITDIKMPGMTGIELLSRIKSENPDTEVIMITGQGDMDIAIESIKRDATDFITKPINDDILDIALKRAKERIVTRRKLRDYTENLERMVQEKSAKLMEVERAAMVSRAFEGISSAIWSLAGDFEGGLKYFNDMPCLVALHDADMNIVGANRLFRDRLGDRIGAGSWTIYKGDSGTPERCPVGRTLQTGKGLRSRETVEYLNGIEYPLIVHTSPVRNSMGEIVLVLEVSIDITEVKRLRKNLEASRRDYRRLFDEVPCYITVQDRNFRLLEANRGFKDDFNHVKEEFCYKVYKQRSEPCPDCPVEKTFMDGKTHHSEMVVTSRNGDEYHVLISTAPIVNDAGEIERVMELSTNITQIRRLQDHLAALGLRIGALSHGIKGLLTGLDGGMYILNSGVRKSDSEKIREGADIVRTMIDRIRQMVLDILYFAKDRELETETVDVKDFAERIFKLFEIRMKEKNIRFSHRLEEGLGTFQVDPEVLSSALINILENAVDACEEKKSDPVSEIGFTVRSQNDLVEFIIEDNGIGMDKKDQDNLFTLFYSTKGKQGTGLGLFISSHIIERHGGDISVTSRKGKGTTFTVRIPKKQGA